MVEIRRQNATLHRVRWTIFIGLEGNGVRFKKDISTNTTIVMKRKQKAASCSKKHLPLGSQVYQTLQSPL